MGNMSGFNANQHEPGRDFDPVPNGKYQAQIVASEQRDIGNGGSSGWKFSLQWKIMGGPSDNRVVFQDILSGYSVQGEKGDKTREIAGSQMGDICRATGKLTPDDTSELHYIPCEITVGLQKQQIDQSTGKSYPPRNEIKGVKPWGQGGQRSGGGQQSRFQSNQNGNDRQQNGGQQQQGGGQQDRQQSQQQSRGGWNRSR